MNPASHITEAKRAAHALQERWPLLTGPNAMEAASIVIRALDEPDRVGGSLELCRVCRAPRRPEERT